MLYEITSIIIVNNVRSRGFSGLMIKSNCQARGRKDEFDIYLFTIHVQRLRNGKIYLLLAQNS